MIEMIFKANKAGLFPSLGTSHIAMTTLLSHTNLVKLFNYLDFKSILEGGLIFENKKRKRTKEYMINLRVPTIRIISKSWHTESRN